MGGCCLIFKGDARSPAAAAVATANSPAAVAHAAASLCDDAGGDGEGDDDCL